jgi:glycosyltransferase involved in cell wall biosynthesis
MIIPVLTIVVPSFNSEKYIRDTLESLQREKHVDVEYILVDGASNDRTMEIVGEYEGLFSQIISEPDSGQSEAFNKGFRAARGKFLTWCNSDDVICPGAMAKVLVGLRTTKRDWLSANCMHIDYKGKVMKCCRSGGYEHFAVKNGLLNVFGPSTFFAKSLYEELGGIDEDFHYCMDTEYWWRIASTGRIFERLSCYFWGLRLHSAAKTANVILSGEYPVGMREEGEKIARRYFPNISMKDRTKAIRRARIWRTFNFSYVFSYVDTMRLRGKRL